ncbi:hypothetical protein Dimus_039650 [Dionaea muscipula]
MEYDHNSGDEGLFVRGRQMESNHNSLRGGSGNGLRHSSSRSRDMNKVRCHYCKELGHMKFECLKLEQRSGGDRREKTIMTDVDEKQGLLGVAVSNSDDTELMIRRDTGRLTSGW